MAHLLGKHYCIFDYIKELLLRRGAFQWESRLEEGLAANLKYSAGHQCKFASLNFMEAYRSGGNWNGVLTVASLMKQLAQELCEELQPLGKPGDATKIALNYCGDVKAGVDLLVNARDWEEALRIAFFHQRDDLVSEVKVASLECANMSIGDLEEGLEKVGKYVIRYLAVRQRRLSLAAKLHSDERSTTEFDDDSASEASCSFSGMSAYSIGTKQGSAASISLSATGGRGRPRNKGKIRVGSPGAEMALVEHLKGNVYD